MKLSLTSLLFFLAIAAYGQDDDTVQYIHGLPQTGEDTVQQTPRDDIAPADSIVQLSPEQLPRDLIKALDENPLYKGWEKSTIQIDKNTGLYWLHIRDRQTVRSYGFDDEGHPVSIREKTDRE
jgi:hypothetical protein